MKLYSYFTSLVWLLALVSFGGGLRAQTADFAASTTNVCPGTFVAFTDLSTYPSGASVSWQWNFPGGFADSDTISNPSVFYPSTGTYSVQLIICVAGGGCDTMFKSAFITVLDEPVADFAWSMPDVCNGVEIAFTNNSFVSGGSFGFVLWDFRDGGGSSDPDPVYTYTSPGSYDVVLLISDAFGCFDDTVITVTTDTLIEASLNIDNTLGCVDPITSTISANVFGGTGPYSYSWDYGNGDVSTAALDSTVYSACTVFDIELDVMDQNGCPANFSWPSAAQIFCPGLDFILSDDTVCAGEPLTVTDASSPPSSSTWLFDPADPTSTATNLTASYTYNTPGTYAIEHCVGYSIGCTQCFSKNVVVTSTDLIGDFSATDSSDCVLPFSTTLTATGGAPGLTYSWQIGSFTYPGNPVSPTITSYGGYNVTLTATNSLGCTDMLTKPAYLQVKDLVPNFNSPDLEGCIPLTPTFTNTSYSLSTPIDSFHWDMGDGYSFSTTSNAPFSHNYPTIGVFDVVLTVYAGTCANSITRQVKTADVVADFMLTDTTCGYVNLINLTNQSTNTTINWGDGSVSNLGDPMGGDGHFYLSEDTMLLPIVLTATQNGCSDSHTDYIMVYPTQIYDFDIRYDCANPYSGTIEILDTWVLSPDFCWDLGNGDTLCGQNPVTITFPTTGSHPVILSDSGNIYFDSLCYQDYFQINIRIDTLDFEPDVAASCDPLTVNFTNANPNPLFDTLNYQYTVGPSLLNGLTGSGTAVGDAFSYSFSTPDVYPIYTTVTDSGICNMFSYDTVIIGEAHAYFDVDSMVGCDTVAVYFGDSSYTVDPSGTHIYIEDWQWSFGHPDCPDYNGVDPPPCYYPLGTYTVQLIASDNGGCVDTFSRSVAVGSGTIPDFTFSGTVCEDDTARFVEASTGPASTFFWDFGDGTSAYGPTADHVYASSGSYTVTLTVYDSEGCAYPHSETINYERVDIQAGFDLSYLSPNACPPIPVLMNDTAIGPVTDLSWLIQTPGGLIDTLYGDSAVYTYLTAGDINITQVITDARGCTDSAHLIDQINIGGLTGDLFLGMPEGCAPLDVFFDLENLNAIQVYIDFGDGDTLQVFGDVWHTYTDTGTYCPSLILIDTAGCQAVYTCPTTVQVTNGPLAGFVLSDTSVCIGEQIWVQDQTTTLSGAPFATYQVDYGDGTDTVMSGSFDSISHNYNIPGTYLVEAVVSDVSGCVDTFSLTVEAQRTPTATLGVPPASCAPYDAPLTLTAVAADSVFINFGDGTTSLISGSVTHSYSSPGIYNPGLNLVDVTGCTNSVSAPPVVVSHVPVAAVGINPDTAICDGPDHILYNLTIDSIIDPLINSVDSLVVELDGSFYYGAAWFDSLDLAGLTAGTHNFALIALNDNGCSDTAFASIEILPAPTATAGPDQVVCPGVPITLDGTGSSTGFSYDWWPPTDVSDPTALVTTYNPAASDTLILTVHSPLCSSTDTVIVEVVNDLNTGADVYHEICQGGAVDLSAFAPLQPVGFDYGWSPLSDMLNPYSLGPTVSPDTSIVYTFTATCGSLMEEHFVLIDVQPPPVLLLGQEEELVFVDFPVQLSSSVTDPNGNVTYQWSSPVAELSCLDCPSPIANPQADGWVYLEITDELGCTVYDSLYLRVFEDCLDGEFRIGRAFTPNGDGLNDEVEFYSETMESLTYFRVFDRWGEMVFETTIAGNGWDGRFREELMPSGVYVYVIQGVCYTGEPFTKTGDVTLIR